MVTAQSFIIANTQPPPGTKTPVAGIVKLMQSVRWIGNQQYSCLFLMIPRRRESLTARFPRSLSLLRERLSPVRCSVSLSFQTISPCVFTKNYECFAVHLHSITGGHHHHHHYHYYYHCYF